MRPRTTGAGADRTVTFVPLAETTRRQFLFYRFVRAVVSGFCYLFWRVRIEGRDNIPASGPFVLSPVHRSNVDTPLMACVTRRRMRFMGKDSLWKYRWSAWFFTSLGGFPVHRGGADREALRNCEAAIRGGEPIVVFPEGTRKTGPVVEPLFDGAAFVATRAGVPIVPVGIGGSQRAMPKGAKLIHPVKIRIVIGPPIAPPAGSGNASRPSRRQVSELSEQLRGEVQRLFDQAQIAAGTPNSQVGP
jgi:1-acyl-sn-glycerol-3-phosphate acyltransferase